MRRSAEMRIVVGLFWAFSSVLLAQVTFTTIETIHFEGIRMVAPREQMVALRFEPNRLVLRSNGVDLKVLAYPELKSAEYSYSERPGGGPRSGTVDRKHWLRVKAEKDSFLLQLDDQNYKMILLKLEGWAGVHVKTPGKAG